MNFNFGMVKRSRAFLQCGQAVRWSTGHGVFLPLVKGSRTIFIPWYCSQTVKSCIADVNFGMVKRSRAFLQCGQAVKQQK